MGFIATNIAKIPSNGFSWYLFVLQDGWNDSFRKEIEENFDRLAAEVGPDCLAIRGADPQEFYNQVIASDLMMEAQEKSGQISLPALVLSNRTIAEIDDSSGIKDLTDVQIMLFPLGKGHIRQGATTDFLIKLASTLKSGSPEDLEKDALSKWSWINDYLEIKPNFFGMGVNFNAVIEKVFQKSKSK